MKSLKIIFIYLALAISVLLVFWQVRNFDFVEFDDPDYVYENQHVTNGLTKDGVIWAFTAGFAANWHPITWLSLMLDCQLFGLNPGRMHLVNVFFHLANTVLLFAVLKKMTGSLWPSAFVAAAFALHPMHVESVAWITERKDVLSTFFLLLTLIAYAGYVRCPSGFRYAAALVLFALGLMSKPMLVTLPFILLLLDYWPLNRLEGPHLVHSSRLKFSVFKTGAMLVSDKHVRLASCPRKPTWAWHPTVFLSVVKRKISTKSTIKNSRQFASINKYSILYRLVIEKVPFAALAVISSTITFLVQRRSGAMTDIESLSFQARFANALLSYVRYIGKMFWPVDLAVFYPFGPVSGAPVWLWLPCLLLLAAGTCLILAGARKCPYLVTGWFWYGITLVPVIGLVQVGLQGYADRYSYIPHIGLFMMMAWGLPQLLSGWPYRRAVLGISMVGVLTAGGLCAYRQTGYWKNNLALFSHAIGATQNNYLMYNNLGAAYDRLGRRQEALEAYQHAVQIKPNDARVYCNLALSYSGLGRHPEAVQAWQQAIKIKPQDAKLHNSLGAAYYALGRYEDAAQAFGQAIQVWPQYADAHNNLGEAYVALARYPEAIAAYQQAIRINPQHADAHLSLGLAYVEIGDTASATKEYEILNTLDIEKARQISRKLKLDKDGQADR